MFVRILLFLLCNIGCSSLKNPMQRNLIAHNAKRATVTRRELFPALVPIASAAAIIAYIYFNIDEIKEKQKVATEIAMTEQRDNISKAQKQQQEAIEKARRQQEAALKNIAEEARNRKL